MRPSSPRPIRIFLGLLLFGFLSASWSARAAADRLRNETAAFLRANAGSLVDWMPWGDAAFERAKREQKPVFVAIGAFTHELSRAMAKQTFSNEKSAALLNQNFVCILVDREERPEVAATYFAYVHNAKQLDGWPLNVWLTPELQPFEGATYLPPSEEWGKASFNKIAQQAVDAWKADPAGCRARAAESANLVAPETPPAAPAEKSDAPLATAANAWRERFDAAHGGFGDPPRNPEPELLRFLLHRGGAEREMALTTLRALANSSLRDPLDGGFFRNAVDEAWRLPSMQKTLSDQTRIALAFLEASSSPDAPAFEQAARGALDYTLMRLAAADGTFAAAEDATAEEQASYYAWTAAEVDTALGGDSAAFKQAHGVEAAGNVSADLDASGKLQGKNLLRSALPSNAKDSAALAKLRAIRDRRPAPARDEHATAGAQGLLLVALARAGEQFHESRYLEAAAHTFEALKKNFLLPTGSDLRRISGSSSPASPTDYAAVALGLREFGRVAKRADANELATKLLSRSQELFLENGRYFATPAKLPTGIFARVPALVETPSAESLSLVAAGKQAQVAGILDALYAAASQPDSTPSGDALLSLSIALSAK
jgi:uncharacterized protein YyaL (SSP411 family)